MQLFYAPDLQGDSHTLDEQESRHIIKVLRMKAGDTIMLTDGAGNMYRGELINEDPRMKRFERIKEMTMADVKKFVDEKIKGNKFVISILGDKNRIDMEKLKKFGEINEISKEELFSK